MSEWLGESDEWEDYEDDEDEISEEEDSYLEALYGQTIDDLVRKMLADAMQYDIEQMFLNYGESPVVVLTHLTKDLTPPDLPSYMLHEFTELQNREMVARALAGVLGENRPESEEYYESLTNGYWDPEYREWRRENPDRK